MMKAYVKARIKVILCPFCGKSFTPQILNKFACSKGCSVKLKKIANRVLNIGYYPDLSQRSDFHLYLLKEVQSQVFTMPHKQVKLVNGLCDGLLGVLFVGKVCPCDIEQSLTYGSECKKSGKKFLKLLLVRKIMLFDVQSLMIFYLAAIA